jgi:hypothetical protein
MGDGVRLRRPSLTVRAIGLRFIRACRKLQSRWLSGPSSAPHPRLRRSGRGARIATTPLLPPSPTFGSRCSTDAGSPLASVPHSGWCAHRLPGLTLRCELNRHHVGRHEATDPENGRQWFGGRNGPWCTERDADGRTCHGWDGAGALRPGLLTPRRGAPPVASR